MRYGIVKNGKDRLIKNLLDWVFVNFIINRKRRRSFYQLRTTNVRLFRTGRPKRE